MINFKKRSDKVILTYSSERPSPEWVYKDLDKSEEVTISKVFTFSRRDLISAFDERNEDDPVRFKAASKVGEYFCFPGRILSLGHDLFIHEDVKLERKLFVAERDISIFPKISKLASKPIYLGGKKDGAIPVSVYENLLKQFPNSYELNKYAYARISSVLSSYIEMKTDHEAQYQKYLNGKIGKKGANIQFRFSEVEILKYRSILDKLNTMLSDELAYTEAVWQEELLQIVVLLYPKYIHVFKEAPVRDTYNEVNRRIDYLLVDSFGNVDIVEIKKPFGKCIVTETTYRDNYIPLRELSGTVMQVEKYLFYLNKWGKKGEDVLTNYYKDELAEDFKIKITNPSGLIIMGRKKGMSAAQLQDFEFIRRKFKSIIDIITYDDLLERLELSIDQWTRIHSKSVDAEGNAPGGSWKSPKWHL